MRLAAGATICFLFAATMIAHAQQAPAANLTVERLMTVEQFRAAGLNKLAPEELVALNTWLQQFATRLTQLTTQNAASGAATATADAIESRMEGEFTGWEGETVFKLDNGQIWQQSSYAYTYHYAYRPKVLIYKSGTGYRMKVDGVESTIAVKRLK